MSETAAFAVELYLDELEARMGASLTEHSQSSWLAHRRGRPAAPPAPSLTYDERVLERVGSLRGMHTGELGDRVETVWGIVMLGCIEADPDVAKLRRDSLSTGAVLRGLFAARNRAALRRGFPGYLELACTIDGTSLAELQSTLAVAPQAVADAEARAGEESEPELDGLQAALDAMTNEHALAVARQCLGAERVSCAARVDFVSGLTPRTYLVAPPDDVRVVTVPPTETVGAFRALWHELGHVAMAAARGGSPSWAMRQPQSRLLDEVVAELFADHIAGDALLVDELGMSGHAAAGVAQIRSRRRARWARRQWARAASEVALYADSEVDPQAAWQRLCEHVGASGSPPWYENLLLAVDPVSDVRYWIAETVRQRFAGISAGRVVTWAAASGRQWRETLDALADPS